MASANTIRRALINLMGAKKANKEALATDSGAIGRPATPNDMINTEINLRDARSQARQAQGVDPLAAKQGRQDIQGPDDIIDDPIENLAIREEAATDITNLAPYWSEVPDEPPPYVGWGHYTSEDPNIPARQQARFDAEDVRPAQRGGPDEITEEMFNVEFEAVMSGKMAAKDAHPTVQDAVLEFEKNFGDYEF
jgi:hypothetical protein